MNTIELEEGKYYTFITPYDGGNPIRYVTKNHNIKDYIGTFLGRSHSGCHFRCTKKFRLIEFKDILHEFKNRDERYKNELSFYKGALNQLLKELPNA